MLRALMASVLEDMSRLAQDKLFSLTEKERRSYIVKELGSEYPQSFVEYLSQVDWKEFGRDVKKTFPFISKGKVLGSHLLKAFRDYLIHDFAGLLDEQASSALGASSLGKTVPHVIERYGALKLARGIEKFNLLLGGETVRVQAAGVVAPEDRRDIRKTISEKYKKSYILFMRDPGVVGGLRIYAGGKLYDMSWSSKVKRMSVVS